MIDQNQLRTAVGATAYDPSGNKIGKVGQVYYDDATGQPTWITVNTGLFGTHESFVPVDGADLHGDRVTVAYDKATVKDAPNIAEDGHLSPAEEEQLYRYYGVAYDDSHALDRFAGPAAGQAVHRDTSLAAAAGVEGRDTSGPTTDNAMTRSEEHLRVGTERRAVGKARLRKYVLTEYQQVTVPVSHEEITLEREPITDASREAAYDGPAISEEEHEITLHADRPVVDTETVAVERVRLGKQTVTDNETVSGEVRKEQIELDTDSRNTGDDTRRPRNR
jgi:uncharacterized protein (TIGR02271 family)